MNVILKINFTVYFKCCAERGNISRIICIYRRTVYLGNLQITLNVTPNIVDGDNKIRRGRGRNKMWRNSEKQQTRRKHESHLYWGIDRNETDSLKSDIDTSLWSWKAFGRANLKSACLSVDFDADIKLNAGQWREMPCRRVS
jgi:hypothetical protein